MKKFKLVNLITGWAIFIVAATVYMLTKEPTASFWDCGEFIACASKLEVSHPPGYPMFAMLGRLAMLFAPNIDKGPMMVNILSGLSSAFTVLFLFWCITHLARKIVGKKEEYSALELVSIIGSGVVGALAFTFSDSFWFSATEAVVFSPSSTFTAAIFWAILKWEDVADEKYSNRWIILIAYLMGLSIGIHLLNLLTIPVLALVYYFRKYKVTKKGVILTILLSFIILEVVMYGIVQGIFVIASWFELAFVNGFGLPYNSGWIFFLLALIFFIVWGIWYTTVRKKVIWNTIILCFGMILIGYSSYTMTILRSNAGTPLNEDNPSNLFRLIDYLSREQYGDRPLIYGQYYNAPVIESKEGKAVYVPKDGKYVVSYYRPKYVYDSRFCTIFPRMFSSEDSHVQAYKSWADIKGTPITITNREGKEETVFRPTFGENLKFFFRYQLGWMYFRYFMWNFSGRQNDLQGHGNVLRGNWISGIKPLDEMRLGPQKMLPDNVSGYKFKNNHAKNTYFLLPFILGLIGLFYHANKHKKDFWLILLFFFMTGIAIILFLNQKPFEPRERDYSYVGSFFAFTIWIGLGVMALIEWIGKNRNVMVGALVTILCLICVPGLMAHENWDDHNRSGRYTCTDFAYDYLNTCEKDAVIFTNGDNDTFPLWCDQEALNIRGDVRVVNLSYFSADWYIKQMQHKVYDSDPLPFSMNWDKYQEGTRDAVYIVNRINDYVPLKQAMDFLASDNPETKTLPEVQEKVEYLPASKFSISVDKSKVLENGTVTPSFANSVVPEIKFQLGKRNVIYKNDMMILDLIANNNWNRPVYFAIDGPEESYLGLQKYFRLDGLGYRFVPIETNRSDGQFGCIDSKILYDNLINKFKWGNINDPKVYLDENNMRMITNMRNLFARLAEQLANENKKDSALHVLDQSFKIMPIDLVPLNYYAIPLIQQYYHIGQIQKANDLSEQLFKNMDQELRYYTTLKRSQIMSIDDEMRMSLYTLNRLSEVTESNHQKELGNKIAKAFQDYLQVLRPEQ